MTRRRAASALALVLACACVAHASPECVRLANALASGGCKDWHAAAARVGAGIVAADCGTLHAVALTMPTPDDACCGRLREFVETGCGCDADVGRLAALGGFGPDTPRGGARLATVTRCADPAAGGRMMQNKCGGNCMPVLAGQQPPGGGGVPPAGLPVPAGLPAGLPAGGGAIGALPASAALAPPQQQQQQQPSGTASAPSPPGAKPAPSVNVPRSRSPAPAPPANGGSGDALVLTGGAGGGGATAGSPPGGNLGATGAKPPPAAAGGGGGSGGGSSGAASSGNLPNVNAMMGVVGPGMLNMPVTPGRR